MLEPVIGKELGSQDGVVHHNADGSSLVDLMGGNTDHDTAWIEYIIDGQIYGDEYAGEALDQETYFSGWTLSDPAETMLEFQDYTLLLVGAEDVEGIGADTSLCQNAGLVGPQTSKLVLKQTQRPDEDERRQRARDVLASLRFHASFDAAMQAGPAPQKSVAQPVTRSRLDVPQPAVNVDLVKLVLWAEGMRTNRPTTGSRLPNVLVCNGTGELSRALADHLCRVTTVSDDLAVILKGKAIPYGSPGAIERDLKEREAHRDVYAIHPVGPGVIYRWAEPHATGLPAASFDLLIVEQAHRLNLAPIIAELQRLARPGAAVMLLGYQPFGAMKPAVTKCLKLYWKGLLEPALTGGERALCAQFADVPFPFASVPAVSQLGRREVVLTAKWNCLEMAAHLDDWPVVQRLGLRTGTHWPAIGQMHTALRQAWGPLKVRYPLSWKVFARVGIAA